MFSYIFPNYFTTTRFFSNTGKSFLTLDDELYCYFIGNKKGYIPMIDKVPYFLREYDEEYYNRIFNDIKTLSDQISEAVQLSQIIPKKINNNDGTNPIFEKFFETHEITENIFDYLEKKGMIKKNTDGLYTLINNYQKKVISIFCYKCKSANPEYDLYKKIFPNFIRNQKEEYKKNGAKDPEYIKNTIIPFYKEICRGGGINSPCLP